jgi:hypothetical protein
MAKTTSTQDTLDAGYADDNYDATQGSGPNDEFAGIGPINLEEFETPTFQVAPAGTYDCFVKNVELRMSKAQNPMWVWQFQAEETPVGRRVFFLHHTLDSNGYGRIKETIVAVNPEFDLKSFDPRTSMGDLITLPCRVQVTVGKFNGQDTNNVRKVMPADDGGGIDSIL